MSASDKSEVRKSQRWSQVANAGGFALRYADPLLEWLQTVTESEEHAREILQYLVNRLAQKGFGERAAGRLADYLLKGAKRVAEAYYRQINPDAAHLIERLSQFDSHWHQLWSQHLLRRARRGLERYQHAHPNAPVYAILDSWEQHPDDQPHVFSARLRTEKGFKIAVEDVPKAIHTARRRMARCLEDEVAETLTHPTPADIAAEIVRLELVHVGNPEPR